MSDNSLYVDELESSRIAEDEVQFEQEINNWFSGQREGNSRPIFVTHTTFALQNAGLEDLPIYVDVSKLKKIRDDHPEVTADVYRQIPKALADPIMILKSSTHTERIIAVVDVKDSTGVNLIIPFELNVDRNEGHVNMIASVYGKGSDGNINYGWYIKNMIDGNLVYANVKKATNFLAPAGVQFPMAARKGNLVTYSIKTENDLVKFKQRKEEEKNMVNYSKVSSEAVDTVYANETKKIANEMERELPKTAQEIIDWAESKGGEYEDPEEERYMNLMKKSAMKQLGIESSRTNAAMYHQEIVDSLTVAEESLHEKDAAQLHRAVKNLHVSMEKVEEAEQTCGADQETWDGYAARHDNIVRRIEAAGDARSEGKSEEECSDALIDAQESLREGTAYMEERCAAILRREKEYQEELAGLRARIEELEREREVRAQLPEELARCLAASTEFLAAVEDLRREAKAQPRIIASEMYSTSRRAVKDAYYSVKLAPTKVKNYLRQRAQKAIDGVLHSVASVFDEGIAALEQRRAGILRKSHEMQSASEFYRDALEEALKDSKAERSMETERTIARSMAKAGFGAYAIEKVLRAESPYRKEMEQGDAKNIAKDAVQETKEQSEEKTR